jgi:hypothetical protein
MSEPNAISQHMPHMESFREWQANKRRQDDVARDKQQRTPEWEAYIAKLKQVHSEPEPAELELKDVARLIKQRGELMINLSNRSKRKEFIIDHSNRPVLRALMLYFLNDPEFESLDPSYSLSKGILLRGGVGLGKTLSLKLFADIRSREYKPQICTAAELKQYGWPDRFYFPSGFTLKQFNACQFVQREFIRGGYEAINPFLMSKEMIFDDLGSENQNAMNYGNKVNIMEEVLTERYELFINQGIRTHITTNIVNADEIQRLYGERIRSRMREMFNTISVEGEDRRK